MTHRSTSLLCLLLLWLSTPPLLAETFETRVSDKDDDAEEFADGWINKNSSDLEMTFERSQQTVGLRFQKIKVPKDSFITNAWVQFEVDEPTSEPTFLTIQGEYIKDAKKFERRRYNISARPRTVAAVEWSPAAWPQRQISSAAQRTPNIAAVVEEIIRHPDWKKDNDLALIITGTGKRVAESVDGSKDGAALLHIEFSDQEPEPEPLETWRSLNLQFDGRSVAVDSASDRLFLPAGEGFSQLTSFVAQVDYALADEGYELGFGFAAPIASGDTYDFGELEFGSSISVQLYQDGEFVETQTLVLTSLPVIELVAEAIVDEPKLPGTFTLSTADLTLNVPEQAMGIEFRGSTSQAFEKKSFGLELRENDDPTDEKNFRLLGMRNDGDWILDAAFRDTSFVRNIVSHDIYNAMRPYAFIDDAGEPQGQATIRGSQVEVVLNESYHGVYILSERVDRKLLDLKKIDVPEDADGNDLWDQVDFTDP
ncbi:MAG: CotH kinase family protein, partial [Pseudomonadales bacterium]